MSALNSDWQGSEGCEFILRQPARSFLNPAMSLLPKPPRHRSPCTRDTGLMGSPLTRFLKVSHSAQYLASKWTNLEVSRKQARQTTWSASPPPRDLDTIK
jgi:hypothetical protein